MRLELVAADADALSDTLNTTLIAWLVEINMPGAPSPRIWWDFDAADDLTARAARDVKVKSLGFRPTLDYIREHYGEGWEEAASDVAPFPPTPGKGVNGKPGDTARDALAELFAEPRWRTQPRDAADDLAEQLLPMTAAPIAAWLDQVRAAVADAATPEEIAFRIQQIIPALDEAELAALITQALAVADLTGRNEAGEAPGGDA